MKASRFSLFAGRWFFDRVAAFWLSLFAITNVALFVDYRFDQAFAPRLDIAFIGLAAASALLHRDRILPFVKSDFFRWFLLLLAVLVVNYLRMWLGGQYTELDLLLETNRLQRVILWPVIGFLVLTAAPSALRIGLSIALVLMPLLVIVDFLEPTLMGPYGEAVNARAQGTYLNANLASEAILLLVGLNARRIKGLTGGLLLVLAGAGVLVTFSRSGMMAYCLFCAAFFVTGRLPKLFLAFPIFIVMSYSSLLLYTEDLLVDRGYESSVGNVLDRLRFIEDLEEGSVGDDSSAESRAEVASAVLKDAFASPVSGHVFSAKSRYGMDPHNQPLHFWYTFGIGGLLVWLGMIWVLVRRSVGSWHFWKDPALALFLWFSLFSHNLLEFTVWIVFLSYVILHPGEARIQSAHRSSGAGNVVSRTLRWPRRGTSKRRRMVRSSESGVRISSASGSSSRPRRRRRALRF